jgi:hypothetical protein
MNKGDDMADELQTLSATVENDVGRYVQLLRHDARTAAPRSPRSVKVTATNLPQTLEVREPAVGEPPDVPTRESRPRSEPRLRPKAQLAQPVILENVTTRLRRETNELLTEAALRQRLKKETPATRQDIVEEALQEWFRKRGYLS